MNQNFHIRRLREIIKKLKNLGRLREIMNQPLHLRRKRKYKTKNDQKNKKDFVKNIKLSISSIEVVAIIVKEIKKIKEMPD